MGRASWRGAVCFDIDGTLVPGTTSGAFLAARLGHGESVRVAEAMYEAGLIDNAEVCRIDALGWAGHSQSEVVEWLDDLPLILGIARTVAWCRDSGLLPFLASLAWDPVGAHLERSFGFASHCGPRLVASGGVSTGDVAVAIDELDKRDIAVATCAEPVRGCRRQSLRPPPVRRRRPQHRPERDSRSPRGSHAQCGRGRPDCRHPTAQRLE